MTQIDKETPTGDRQAALDALEKILAYIPDIFSVTINPLSERVRNALSAPDHAENKPLRNILEWMANDEANYNADELRFMAKKALLLCETKKGGA